MLASYTHSPLIPDDILSTSVTSAGVTAGLGSSAGHFYYLKDALGSITDIMNTSGAIVQKYDYSSFGKILSIKDGGGVDISANPILMTSFTFTGREWDAESGLYYYRARTYDPQIGRFLQIDPDPGKIDDPITTTNKYIYASNSPMKFIDSSGQVFFEIATIGAIVGGVIGGVANGIKYNWNLGKVLEGVIQGSVLGFFYGTIVEADPVTGGALIGSNALKSVGRGGNTIVNFFENSKNLVVNFTKTILGSIITSPAATSKVGANFLVALGVALFVIDVSEYNCDEKEGTWHGSDYCHAYQTPFR